MATTTTYNWLGFYLGEDGSPQFIGEWRGSYPTHSNKIRKAFENVPEGVTTGYLTRSPNMSKHNPLYEAGNHSDVTVVEIKQPTVRVVKIRSPAFTDIWEGKVNAR